MEFSLSPLDGRYKSQTEPLRQYLSEFGLNKARIFVELSWFVFIFEKRLFNLEPLDESVKSRVFEIYRAFDENEAEKLKNIENTTKHDVKAVEIYIADKLESIGLEKYKDLVHIFCTSEDINNLSYALSVKAAVKESIMPFIKSLVYKLESMAKEYKNIAMLSKTHGQPATPTTLGKELAVFAFRLKRQADFIERAQYLGKFSGATGTFSAHMAAAPEYDWLKISIDFVNSLGLTHNPLTTQIEPHDYMAELFNAIWRFNLIAHNLATDIWLYISNKYFIQKNIAGEVGSSTMPHKINPIKFENAEANLELSNALLNSLAATLPTSRLQRDLTDSSAQRNIGSAFGHAIIAYSNLIDGLARLDINKEVIQNDLENNPEVLAEAIQTVIRVENIKEGCKIENPYNLLKDLTRGNKLDKNTLIKFIKELDISDSSKNKLLALEPKTYIGIADKLVDKL